MLCRKVLLVIALLDMSPAHAMHGKGTRVIENPQGREASVTTIAMQTKEGFGLCTGTFISDSVLLTASHCLNPESGEAPQVFDFRSKARSIGIGFLRKDGATLDVGLVRFPEGTYRGPVFRLSYRDPQKDSRVQVFGTGTPYEMIKDQYKPVLRAGNVLVDNVWSSALQLMGPPQILPGDSGGPVIDREEQAIVAVNSSTPNESGVNFAVDAIISDEDLKAGRVPFHVARIGSNKKNFDTRQLVEFFEKAIGKGWNLPKRECSCERKQWKRSKFLGRVQIKPVGTPTREPHWVLKALGDESSCAHFEREKKSLPSDANLLESVENCAFVN